MILQFSIKYLAWLKHVPLLPHLMESLLKMESLLLRPQVLNMLDAIEQEALQWEGVHTGLHKYGGLQLNYRNREIGHIHGDGTFDILLNRRLKAQLMASAPYRNKLREHHTLKNTGWATFYIRHKEDLPAALELLRVGYGLRRGKGSIHFITLYDSLTSL